MKNPLILLFLSVFLVLIMIPKVFASDSVSHNLLDIPTGLSEALGIGTFAAGLLTSIILLMVCLLPCVILTLKAKGNQATIFVLITGMSLLGFDVAVGWFPIWMFAVIVLLIAVMYGKRFADAF